jgi:hypothetical protein
VTTQSSAISKSPGAELASVPLHWHRAEQSEYKMEAFALFEKYREIGNLKGVGDKHSSTKRHTQPKNL